MRIIANISPNEAELLREARRNRPQGYACDDGIVRCKDCVQSIIDREGETSSILPVEAYTPYLGDGDDWCSVCDRDVKARES